MLLLGREIFLVSLCSFTIKSIDLFYINLVTLFMVFSLTYVKISLPLLFLLCFLMLKNILFSLNWAILNVLMVFTSYLTVFLICIIPLSNLSIQLYSGKLIVISYSVVISIYLKFPGRIMLLVLFTPHPLIHVFLVFLKFYSMWILSMQ